MGGSRKEKGAVWPGEAWAFGLGSREEQGELEFTPVQKIHTPKHT